MYGIDISNWQKDIDLDKVSYDALIAKCTEGTEFVDPCCHRFVSHALNHSRPAGVYHYITGQGAEREASHFVEQAQSYIGKCILVLDWESGSNRAWKDEGYLEQMIDVVTERTGVIPFVYASALSFPFSLCQRHGCGRWIAQYQSNRETGYQTSPWNEGAYQCEIRQYTSNGRLKGYPSSLDLNKVYISPDEWASYAKGSKEAPKSQLDVDGKWGCATTAALQLALGTPADGLISNQRKQYVKYYPAILRSTLNFNWMHGSIVIRHLQDLLGIKKDGIMGPDTIMALQERIGVEADGICGPKTVMALQERLNLGFKIE